MSYGAPRFLYQNQITAASMITASSQATGIVGGAQKVGTGAAVMQAVGAFSHTQNLTYLVQIDAVGTGEIGSSTYRWRTSATAVGSWEASGVTTSTTLTALNYGVMVSWPAVSGSVFVLNDSWYFEATAVFGAANLLDLDRNTVFRFTGDTSESFVIDLGSAQLVTALILHDHNLTAAATINLYAHTSDSWGSPDYSNTGITSQDPVSEYLSETYRYWKIELADAANPDGYLEFAGLYLGTYLELEIPSPKEDYPISYGYLSQSNESTSGVQCRKAVTSQIGLTLDFGNTVSNNDVASLVAMQGSLVDIGETGKISPLYVHQFFDEPDSLRLMDWQNIIKFERRYYRYLLNSVSLSFLEKVKTRV